MKGFSCFLILFIVACFVCVSSANQRNRCHNQVPCDNLQCIDKEGWCNGFSDCSDGSDEKYCKQGGWWTAYPNDCTEKHFICSNGMCVPKATSCDGYPNCLDGSDEERCDEYLTESPSRRDDTLNGERPSATLVGPGRDTMHHISEISKITTETADTRTSSTDAAPHTRPTTQTTTSYYDRKLLENTDQHMRNRQQTSSQRAHGRTTASNDIRPDLRTPGYEHRPPQFINIPTRPPVMKAEYELQTFLQQSQEYKFRIHRQILYSPVETPITLKTPPDDFDPAGPLPVFTFWTNYNKNFGYKYKDPVQKAESWILDRRSDSYRWGKDTPRALIALSLISNSFLSSNSENELMERNFAMDLGVELMQLRRPSDISGSKLAIYINALLATCQDPRHFLHFDLVQMLANQNDRRNPYLYLTLCLANYPLSDNDVRNLLSSSDCQYQSERCKATRILATTALACFHQREELNNYLTPKLNEAFRSLQNSRRPDGSFGSIYTTAIAAQALMSINNDDSWDPQPTLDYLLRHQKEDGSFGDFLATYHALLALSGRSLLHIRNTQCNRIVPKKKAFSPEDLLQVPGPKKSIFYTLKIGNPTTSSLSLFLSLPSNANFFEAMKVAEFISPKFKFLYAESNGFIDVHTISGHPNDPERNYRWYLYRVRGQEMVDLDLTNPYTENVLHLIPDDKEEIIFWYLTL